MLQGLACINDGDNPFNPAHLMLPSFAPVFCSCCLRFNKQHALWQGWLMLFREVDHDSNALSGNFNGAMSSGALSPEVCCTTNAES